MFLRKPTCPVDYRLCRQTVTVYHKDGDTITRTVHDRAFLDFKKTRSVDKTGSKDATAFLLIIPGEAQTAFVGDKVILGEGPEITSAQWAKFIPSLVPGLAVVSYADPKYWGTQFVHTEAGG